jgi:hypothetical protein
MLSCVTTEPTMKTSKKLAGNLVGLAVIVIGLFAASGCGTVQPYERGKLAHPTMAAGEQTGFGESHLRAISEGAIGGSAGSGSGCGCN